jgi:hypothetical protein
VSVLTLAEVKAHLNITVTTYDAELMTFADSAEAVIARRCGPLTPTAAACRVRGGQSLALPDAPVVSLTSVTPVGGTALPLADLYLDGAAGVVTYNQVATFGSSAYGFTASAYDVAYEAGREILPDDLLHGLKELVRHFWSTSQRGGSRRPGSEAMAAPSASFLLPYQVQSAIEPHLIGPGVT